MPDVAQLVEELEHPERSAELVPSEGRRRDLLGEMPGEVERVGAIEHAEVIALAPDDLLAARAHDERNAPEPDVGVGLAELVLELEGVASALGQPGQREVFPREPPQLGVLEQRVTRVGLPVHVLLLERVRRRVVDAVVDTAVLDEQEGAFDERDGVLVVELPRLHPVVLELEMGRVPVLDELEVRVVGMANQVLAL